MKAAHHRRSASSALDCLSEGDWSGGHGYERSPAMMGDEARRSSSSTSRPDEGPKPAGLHALPRRVAVAVGGGGVLGAAQVGVGYALEQRGFVPDLIVGTSVGALNGAIAAAHPGKAAPLFRRRRWIRSRRSYRSSSERRLMCSPGHVPGGSRCDVRGRWRRELELGVLRNGYPARWYSLISPLSTFRRSIRRRCRHWPITPEPPRCPEATSFRASSAWFAPRGRRRG
ncbi:patatin-like phospholipase family protein [Nonomuraea sp. B19D2]|uniref:patatin-like phospholipase family protein n=1 Tax=Nonomuraea sp. B19D2 TaxID=3159561 RepID=UPI0032D9D9C1